MGDERYDSEGFFDELIAENGEPRPAARRLMRELRSLPPQELQVRNRRPSVPWSSPHHVQRL